MPILSNPRRVSHRYLRRIIWAETNAIILFGRYRLRFSWMIEPSGWKYAIRHLGLVRAIQNRGWAFDAEIAKSKA